MVNFQLIALIVGIIIVTMIVTNVLRMLGIESAMFLILMALLIALVTLILTYSRLSNVYSMAAEIQAPESLKNTLSENSLTKKQPIKTVKERVWLLSIEELTFQYKRKTTRRKIGSWVLFVLLSVIWATHIHLVWPCPKMSHYS